jgi:hypothetical protein
MQLVKRSAFGWGTTGAAHARPSKGLAIHYDGSDQGLAGKPHASCVDYWRRTRKFHTGANRQWVDIGYSFGACPHGYIFEGRGENRTQAAQPGGNTTWYSVTLMSGPGESPTEAQIEAVRELRAYLMGRGLGSAVKGHRDFYSTSCPGDRLYRLVRDGTFAKPPKGSKTAPETSEEGDVSAQDVIHGKHIVMNKGEDGEKKVSLAAFLQEIETEQDRTQQRLDRIEAKQDEILAKLGALGK